MSNFSETTVNPGSGGAKIASDTFTQGADTVTLVYSGIAFGTLGGGSYQAVDATHGMPVNVVAGTVTVGAGSALIGQVELSDGSNTLGTSAHPVRTDPTGTTTQPVSGTVTANAGSGTFAVSAASLPLPSGAATANKQPALGTPGTASADVISVQGIAGMTALKVDGSAVTQPVSGTVTVGNAALAVTQSGAWSLAAHQSTNVDQFNGTAVDTNSGNKSAGTLRVVIATDQPQLTAALKVDGSGVTQPVSIAGTVAVSGAFWQATQPVSLASLPALASGSNNAGYFTPAASGTTGGLSSQAIVAAAGNNLTTVKSTSAKLWRISATNFASSPRFVKIFNGAPTMGTTAAYDQLALPSAGNSNGAGEGRAYPVPEQLSNGLYVAITAGIALSDNTPVSANDVALSISFE